MKHEAFLYDKRDDKKVRCKLCSHRCIIRPGARGICRVRENRDGTLYSLNYDKVIATHVDPIEKKPLFHFKPGSRSFSIATVGCNFSCTFCQNHDISQWMNNGNDSPVGDAIAPGRIVQLAKESGSASIAFTYTEPTIFAELAYDVARLAKDEGIASVFVSNGYMTPEMIEYFGPLIAAANIDLKAFKDESYREVIGGRLQPVLDNIRLLKANDTWLELTTLIIPGFNDSDAELGELAAFIADVDPGIPWHVSAFHPTYRMTDRGRTLPETLHKAHAIGRAAGLRYVFTGNVLADKFESTYCPVCGKTVIERIGYSVKAVHIEDGGCRFCHTPIDGIY